MATSDNVICSVCEAQSVQKIAVKWCPECDEAFCSQCLQFHSYAKSTKNHAVVDVCDYKKLPSFLLEIKTHCQEHQAKFQNYCMIHECPCCSKCINTSHKTCNDLPPIDDVIQNAKSSASLVDIEERLHQLQEFFGNLRKEKEDNEKKIVTECKIILEQIKQKRLSLNQYLDKLEIAATQNILLVEQSECDHMQKISQELKANEERIGTMLEGVNKMRQHASNLQTFLGNIELERETRETEKTAEDLTTTGAMDTKYIVFQENRILASFKSDVKSFGEVSVATGPSKVFHVKPKEKQAQIATLKEFDDLRLEFIRSINVGRSSIFGCVLLENGNAVFVSKNSNELIVIDCNGSTSYTITLPFKPYDITCIDETRLAVSSKSDNKVYIVNMTKKEVERFINAYSELWICYRKGKVICSHKDKGLIEVDLDTEKLTELTVGIACGPDGYVAVFGDRVYSRDSTDSTVTCWDCNFKKVWSLTNENVLNGLRGIAVDNRGNVYTGFNSSPYCVIISPDGQKYKQISLNGVSKPRILCFDQSKSQMLVCDECGSAGVFSVSY